MNADNMNNNHSGDAPVFKPDLNIVYPNKQELYRKEVASPVFMIKRLMVAASLILTAGVIWWLTTEEQPEQSIANVAPAILKTPSEQAPSQPQQINTVPSDIDEIKAVRTIKKERSAPTLVISTSEVLVKAGDLSVASSSEKTQQEAIVAVAVVQSRSNFTEEALQASAQLAANDISVKGQSQQEKVEVYIPMNVEREKKKPFRGLVRKLSRTIFGEGESLGDEHIIRVANFKIPVAD